jgi:hypothetical protein
MKSGLSEVFLVGFILLFVIGLGFAGCSAITTGWDNLVAAQPTLTPTPDPILALADVMENQSEALVNLSELAQDQNDTIGNLTDTVIESNEDKIAMQQEELKEKDVMMIIIGVLVFVVTILLVSVTKRANKV